MNARAEQQRGLVVDAKAALVERDIIRLMFEAVVSDHTRYCSHTSQPKQRERQNEGHEVAHHEHVDGENLTVGNKENVLNLRLYDIGASTRCAHTADTSLFFRESSRLVSGVRKSIDGPDGARNSMQRGKAETTCTPFAARSAVSSACIVWI